LRSLFDNIGVMQMNKITCALSVLALAIAPTLALAGPGGTTCAGAEVLAAGGTYTGDTSNAAYSNVVGGFGPLPSPAADSIYTFTAVSGVSGSITVTAAGYNFGIFLEAACAAAAPPPINAATGPAAPQSMSLAGVAAGTQYWVIGRASARPELMGTRQELRRL
jgi:hypothetical protein